jgi:hypothetical protein
MQARDNKAMKFSMASVVRLFLLGCVVPILMSLIVYQGFSTNYTARVFSEQGFHRQYDQGIYRYRVLGKIVFLKTYDAVKQYGLPTIAPASLKLQDPQGDRQFYSAYFYVNTFFLCLMCIVLFFIFGRRNQALGFLTLDLPILFLCSLIALTQYVVAPYDILSYFFLTVAAWLIVRGDRSLWNPAALCMIVILATLTRETAVLIPAFHFAVHYKAILTKPTSFKINKQQGIIILLAICFTATYIALRMAFGSEQALFQRWMTLEDFTIYPIAGLTFAASILLLLFLSGEVTTEMTIFFIAALPYIASIPFIANPWEIRLWMPVILFLMILKMQALQSEARQGDSAD